MPRIPQEPAHCDHHCKPAQDSSVDVKLKILETKFVPKDLIKTFDTLDNVEDTAYVYVDADGNPYKVQATKLISKDVSWDQLSKDVQDKILEGLAKQDKLTAGDNINIKNNVISADVGVKSINGSTGDVTVTPESIGAMTKDATIELVNTTVEATIEEAMVDGGAITE